MDKLRKQRADLFRATDILLTKAGEIKAEAQKLEIFNHQLRFLGKRAKDNALKIGAMNQRVTAAIDEIVDSDCSEESIVKAERLYKELNENR